jgi:hypothetical protein
MEWDNSNLTEVEHKLSKIPGMLPLTGGVIASYWTIAQDNDLHIKLIVWDQELRTFLIAPLVQLDRMSDYESDGRGFEPPKEYFLEVKPLHD